VVILFREMNLLLVPYWADTQLDLIQWPPFLLASKVCFIFYATSLSLFLLNHLVILFVAIHTLDPNCIRYGEGQ
jgi:callose synthase